MKTRIYTILTISLLVILILAPSNSECQGNGEYHDLNITVDGLSRSYKVYEPEGHNPSETWPLVFLFHGLNGTPDRLISITEMFLVADTAKFLIIYPQGLMVQDIVWGGSEEGWYVPGAYLPDQGQDDVQFVSEMIDEMIENPDFGIDTNRIFATGYSNGGEFVYYLACAISDRIASVAGVAGQMTYTLMDACTPNREISVLHLLGTDDQYFPQDGNDWFPPLEGTAEFWAEINSCNSVPTEIDLPDLDPNDGSTVTLLIYDSCFNHYEVLCYRIEGGEHSWPGGWLPWDWEINNDIHASVELWNFFKRNPHPDAYHCLADGFYFSSQNQIDNFQSDHPYCEEIMGDVEISGNDITNLDGFENIKMIDGKLKIFNNPNLENVSGFGHLETINGDFEVGSNGSLVNFSGLENLKTIDGDLKIYNNAALNILTGLDSITPESIKDLIIAYNENLSYCHIESICYYLYNGPYGSVTIQDNKPDSDCSNATRLQQSCPPPVDIAEQGFESLTSINPNPFTTSTTFEYELNQPETATITFYNQFGKLVDVIEVNQQKGLNRFIWTPENLADGVYYFRLEAGEQIASGKVVRLR
jgi:polyhydroxybutyrate depolymerase